MKAGQNNNQRLQILPRFDLDLDNSFDPGYHWAKIKLTKYGKVQMKLVTLNGFFYQKMQIIYLYDLDFSLEI